ncbi:hypothetical protein H6F61_22270 [Cyanobacteria bacterium FACHB-472]|nr:hypothetical protein [Cyanobacteria bacterium FACHB-472]
MSAWLISPTVLAYQGVCGVPAIIITLLYIRDYWHDFEITQLYCTGWENQVLVTCRAYGAASLTHYSLITLVALVFIPFLMYWNLLGFQF